jgi:hypothetical protein
VHKYLAERRSLIKLKNPVKVRVLCVVRNEARFFGTPIKRRAFVSACCLNFYELLLTIGCEGLDVITGTVSLNMRDMEKKPR